MLLLIRVALLSQKGRTLRDSIKRHNTLLVIAAWLIDVGLIVNMVLKAYSGRPRPDRTLLFGGDLQFMPNGHFGGACLENCSFISGEAASAGWFLCVLALLPPVWQKRLFLPVLLVGLLTGFLRVGFGRHFLSDALLGFLSAPIVFLLLIAIFGWKKAADNQ